MKIDISKSEEMLNEVFFGNGLSFKMEYNPATLCYEFEVDVSKLLVKAARDIEAIVMNARKKIETQVD